MAEKRKREKRRVLSPATPVGKEKLKRIKSAVAGIQEELRKSKSNR